NQLFYTASPRSGAYERPGTRFRFGVWQERAGQPNFGRAICPRQLAVFPACMIETVRKATALSGRVDLPADKSIAHRTAILSALGDGTSEIIGYPAANDPQSTLHCLQGLGIEIEETDASILIHGKGLKGLKAPVHPLDCGNSGTTMRLLAGVLAGQAFESILVGDESLTRRPMGRIADPLALMGAHLALRDGRPPIRVAGRVPLRAIRYELPVPSAQVKSCILLAGLYADGETMIVERLPSRDHTERM